MTSPKSCGAIRERLPTRIDELPALSTGYGDFYRVLSRPLWHSPAIMNNNDVGVPKHVNLLFFNVAQFRNPITRSFSHSVTGKVRLLHL